MHKIILKKTKAIQRQSKIYQMYGVLTIIILTILISQFLDHDKVGDDWPNSQIPSMVKWRYGEMNSWLFWNTFLSSSKDWIEGQGRFFPVGQFVTLSLHTLFSNQAQQNLVISFIYLLMIISWCRVIYKITFKSIRAVCIFSFALLLMTRFRTDFEPHIGFGLLLPTMLLFLGSATLLLIKTIDANSHVKKLLWGTAAGICVFLALSTYELAIFGLVTVFGITFSHHISKYGRVRFGDFLSIYMPSISFVVSYLMLVFLFLRPRANPTGAYVSGFDFDSSIIVFLNHTFAGIPMLNTNLYNLFKIPNSGLPLALLSAIGIATYVLSKLERRYRIKKSQMTEVTHIDVHINQSWPSFILYISLLLTYLGPGAMLSIQPIWWGRVNWGNSYLGVILQELALAIAFTLFFSNKFKFSSPAKKSITKAKALRKRDGKVKNGYRVLSGYKILICFILITTTILHNQRFVDSTELRRPISAAWQALLLDNNFFSLVNDGDYVISTTHNDAYEINAYDLYNRTNIRLSQMLPMSQVFSNYDKCKKTSDCPITDLPEKSYRLLSNYAKGDISGEIDRGSRSFVYRVLEGLDSKRSYEDWVGVQLNSDKLSQAKFYFFNIYPITKDVIIAYIAPFTLFENEWKVDLGKIEFRQFVYDRQKYFKVAIGNVCLTKDFADSTIRTDYGLVQRTSWFFETDPKLIDPQGNSFEKYMHPRDVEVFICGF